MCARGSPARAHPSARSASRVRVSSNRACARAAEGVLQHPASIRTPVANRGSTVFTVSQQLFDCFGFRACCTQSAGMMHGISDLACARAHARADGAARSTASPRPNGDASLIDAQIWCHAHLSHRRSDGFLKVHPCCLWGRQTRPNRCGRRRSYPPLPTSPRAAHSVPAS